jgi:methionyl-tRNA formyltransferase
VYFGSGAFGLPTLTHLAANHTVLAVVTQPDKPAGRGGQLTPTPIAAWTAQHMTGVPLLKPAKVNDPAVVEQVRSIACDAWVVIAFGQKLGRALLADRFAINLHASLLPRWRGAAPINAAILAGDSETGNSVITLADRMDAGLVLGQSRRALDPMTTTGEMHDLLAGDGPALVDRVLARHAAGEHWGDAQDESRVTIAPKLSKADGVIDFASGPACQRRVHALNPWPGVTMTLAPDASRPTDTVDVKLLRAGVASLFAPHGKRAGDAVAPAQGLFACADGSALQLNEVQPAGKRAMAWADFARGRALAPSARFVLQGQTPGAAP